MDAKTILAAAQKPAQDRTARYSARLDAHLATLASDEARSAFLDRENAKWVERYRVFAEKVDSGRVPITADTPTAWDYTLTLAAIDQRMARYRPAVEPDEPVADLAGADAADAPFWTAP